MHPDSTVRFTLTLIAVMALSSGCSTLIGNIKPVEDKSTRYKVIDLSLTNSEWTRLGARQEDPSGRNTPETVEKTQTSDLSFQSKKTASIISLNSACREDQGDEEHSLKDFSRTLLLGISEIKTVDQKNLQIDQVAALETTVDGKLNSQPVKLRTVVLKDQDCLFDLMYVARPEHFLQNEDDFEKFISSLRLH